ncbi:MAG: hypothetical protein HKN17_00190, partial [Rhodothermales bacterium]|nr:hypothetical protein [Rhodothermales bacterium]
DADEPFQDTIEATAFELSDSTDVTGGVTTTGAVRTLAGVAEDPFAGTIEALGHFDLTIFEDGGSDFRSGELESVELVLAFDYVFGDTTSTVEFELRDISAAWSADGRRSQNPPPVDVPIMTFSVNASADQVRIELPSNWVDQHALEIQTTSFESLFHGFQLRPVSGNAVLGISSIDSEMIAATVENDTSRYAITRRHSMVNRSGGQIPAGSLLLQDGAQSVVSLRFPVGEESLDAAAIHRFLIRLTQSDGVPAAPQHFVWPSVTQIGLRAVALDQTTALTIQTIDVDPDSEQLLFDSSVIASVVQRALQQNSNLDRFEVYVPTVQSGVGYLLLNDLSAGTGVPNAIVTLTDLN